MRVLKFGGTSLKNAKSFLNVFNIIKKKVEKEQIAVVLSASDTITDTLENLIKKSTKKKVNSSEVDIVYHFFYKLLLEVYSNESNYYFKSTIRYIKIRIRIIKEFFRCIASLNHCPDSIYAKIISMGEFFSTEILKSIFLSKGFSVTIIDPVENFIAVQNNFKSNSIDVVKSCSQIKKLKVPKQDIILMPGFVAGNKKKELVILGRNGSDYSASVLSVCLNASYCEIWKDVDGIYSFNPKIVNNSLLLDNLSYEEAKELSHFGSEVLHPRTIEPLQKNNVNCIVKNSLNILSNGTVINNVILDNKFNVKGITNLNNIVMVKFSISKLQKKNNLFSRVFLSLEKNNSISILLINKLFLKNEIIFYVTSEYGKKIKNLLEEEFNLEISNKIVNPIEIVKGFSMVSIIGKNVCNVLEIIKKCFIVLSYLQIKIKSIVFGLSNNSFSIILEEQFALNVVKNLHVTLFNVSKITEIFLIGLGNIGSALLDQIDKQANFLKKKNIELKFCGIANSRHSLVDINGINPKNWKESLLKNKSSFTIQKFIEFSKKNVLYNPVLVDCTSDEKLASSYVQFLSNGFNVVAASKKANTSSMRLYSEIRRISNKYKKKFLYETNVGAGLPVIRTLKDMLSSGNDFISFRGVLSGSLSFIFGKLEEGMLFSKAVKKAQKMGFTEPHPYEDLSGIDVARKLLILAREVGFSIELKNIFMEPIIPDSYGYIVNREDFMEKLKDLDEHFFKLSNKAKESGAVLRFIAIINEKRECCLKICCVKKNDPLYTVKNGENALSFYSKYYNPIPLVLRGYGAGNHVTASGVFSDLLYTV